LLRVLNPSVIRQGKGQLAFRMVLFGAVSLIGIGCRRAPDIIQTNPPDGSTVGVTSWIEIVFDTEMDHSSVEAGLLIMPSSEGEIHWEEEKLWFIPDLPFEPGQRYTVVVDQGAQSIKGTGLREVYQWSFTARQPSIIYLSPVDGPASIWTVDGDALNPAAEIPVELEGNLQEYSVSLDGSELVYVVENDQGGSDLLLGERLTVQPQPLVRCGEDQCASPEWSPSGHRIAYSRAPANGEAVSGFDPPRLWTVDPRTRATSELLHDDHVLVGSPSWSPDERRIAFYDRTLDSIRILNLENSEEQVLATGHGSMGGWSPDGSQMIFSVLEPVDDGFSISLQLVDLRSQETEIIFGESAGWLDVGQPQWSPTGEWIVVGLQSAVGRQLWLIQPDGSEMRPIVVDASYTHGGYRWGPWGERIVFQRFPLSNANSTLTDQKTEVMIWSLTDGETHLLARDAWMPNWLP
jgi:Tol biopolymer transport system component